MIFEVWVLQIHDVTLHTKDMDGHFTSIKQ